MKFVINDTRSDKLQLEHSFFYRKAIHSPQWISPVEKMKTEVYDIYQPRLGTNKARDLQRWPKLEDWSTSLNIMTCVKGARQHGLISYTNINNT